MFNEKDYKENTLLAQGVILDKDVLKENFEIFKNIEYAFELDKRNAVLDGVIERMKIIEPESSSDISSIREFLRKKYKSLEVEGGLPRTVKNWLDSGNVNTDDENNRENLYILCMALDCNWKETVTFFIKHYMTIPFVPKSRIDVLYYYGISKNKKYVEIQDIKKKTEGFNYSTTDALTSSIISEIDEIDDDNKMIEYLMSHTFSREKRYQTAKREINNLIKKCYEKAEIEETFATIGYHKNVSDENNGDADFYEKEDNHISSKGNKDEIDRDNNISINKLINVIYGYDTETVVEKKSSKLPMKFLRSLPLNQQFSQIESDKASPETLRKALVILNFYDFFGNMIIIPYSNNKRINYNGLLNRSAKEVLQDFKDYSSRTTELLSMCGFEGLYPRNVFDWIIEYCAYQVDPLSEFRALFSSEEDE